MPGVPFLPHFLALQTSERFPGPGAQHSVKLHPSVPAAKPLVLLVGVSKPGRRRIPCPWLRLIFQVTVRPFYQSRDWRRDVKCWFVTDRILLGNLKRQVEIPCNVFQFTL